MLGTSWHSYPKIYALGHKIVVDLFKDSVIIQEKVDGSQFSFGVFNGEIKCRSKGQELIVDAPEKMFEMAVETVKALAPVLKDGYTYRGEYLQKPKHNTLAYDRIPTNYIILFDVNKGEEDYLSYQEAKAEAERIGLEIVPLLFEGMITDPTQLVDLLDRVSCLGGAKIEGFVMKNYAQFGPDKKVLMAKHVSEHFKEVHQGEWKTNNPRSNDIIQMLITKYKTPARFDKGIQHLKESGKLTDSPKDIGILLKEVKDDIKAECSEEIKEALFNWAWDQMARGVTNGLPEYYKNHLMQKQFEKPNEVEEGIKRREVLDKLVEEAQELKLGY